jgi:GTP pyrophosphokinase
VGNRMIGAKVNKRIVPIDYVVNNGEIVEIMTTKEVTNGPSRDWLNIAKTSEAKNKIRQWFKREKREENIQTGRTEVDRELRRSGITLTDSDLTEILSGTLKKKNCATIEDLYCAIGYGGIALSGIMPKIKEEYAKRRDKDKEAERSSAAFREPKPSRRHKGNGILVEGMENCLTKLSKCCSPLPGDDIIGFITRGYGVSIHKRECSNVPVDLSTAEEPERWVKAHWVENITNEQFVATLEIVADTRKDLILDVMRWFDHQHLTIQGINSREMKDGATMIHIMVPVSSVAHSGSIIMKLSECIAGCRRVCRI